MKYRVLREILLHCGCLSSAAVVQITEFFGPTCVRSLEKLFSTSNKLQRSSPGRQTS